MDVKDLILKTMEKKGEVRASEIVKATGFSRVYVNRFFRQLREEGVLTLVGKANAARYVPATEEMVSRVKKEIKKLYRILKNDALNEDEVLANIKKKTGIFEGLRDNVSDILGYAFTEMLNNAIEHSRSARIELRVERKSTNVMFEVRDRGVGIFNNIMKKKDLGSELEAIQDLLKGKETTEPAAHSGEGIFFTSRVGDILTIQSSKEKLVFDNLVNDIFLKNVNKRTKGTRVLFSVSLGSKKRLSEIFEKYTDDSFQFSKTEVIIKLYKKDADYVSRSQARRLLSGLEKFKTIVLDFKGIDTIGQGFADEIFRVWKKTHPGKSIIVKNAGKNAIFMIKRAGA